MNTAASRWLAARTDSVVAAGRRRLLDSALGTVLVADDHAGPPPPLSWPSSGELAESEIRPFGTLVATRHEAPPEITRALRSAQAHASQRTGRGAFPVRWLPGQPWIARYENGPIVLRDGSRLLMTATTTGEAATWASKVLRELLIHGGVRRGFRLCHAAVIGGRRSGLLITGPTGAGKTDLALKLARQLRVPVVSVDRCVVGQRGAVLVAGTLPFGLNIHRDTLAGFGCSEADLARRYPPQKDKHYLDILAAQRLCQVTMRAWSPITAVISLQRGPDTIWWQRLGTAAITDTLRFADVAGTDPGYQIDWLGLGGGKHPPALRAPEMLTGWILGYRPDQPLPEDWASQVGQALHAPAS
ncbi:MAG TPA: isopentenyl transferase family protein [Streptosporangiaceae bacterium]|nr:isopentenyl transferase family protein [Streptosporangiaceae bacterium]